MHCFEFNPTNGEHRIITKHQHSLMKQELRKKHHRVMMCQNCKSIIHQSSINIIPVSTFHCKNRTVENNQNMILRSVKTSLNSQKIIIFCNQCQEEIGTVSSENVKLNITISNMLHSSFEWKQKKNIKKEEKIICGSYSGMRIKTIERLLLELAYQKATRYSQSMHQLYKKTKQYLNGFTNFIFLINIFKEEEAENIEINNKLAENNKIQMTKQNLEEFKSIRNKSKLKSATNVWNKPSLKKEFQIQQSTAACHNRSAGKKSLQSICQY